VVVVIAAETSVGAIVEMMAGTVTVTGWPVYWPSRVMVVV
jgi:hypothetical protein